MQMLRRLSLFAVIVSVVLVSGCATVPRGVETRQPLSELCRQAGVDFSFDPVSLSAHLSKNGKRASVLAGSNRVTVGADTVLLNSPVVFERQELYASEDFREKVLCRLDVVFCLTRALKGELLIVIDPGHGGKDSGAVSRSGLKEKEVVLDISRRLERLLTASGYNVKLTRTTDVFISLEERTQRATEWGADIFISIHANASPSDRTVGFEIWTVRSLTREDFEDRQREKNQKLLFSRLNMQRRNLFLEKTVEDMSYRHKYRASLELADVISKNYSHSVGNRGMKQSGFFVLRNTLVPSVLVEVGFLSNTREAQHLKTSSHREEIAESLADGVRAYLRGR